MDGPFIQFESTAQELEPGGLPFLQPKGSTPVARGSSGSQVPDPASFSEPPHRLNHVMRRQATRFINNKESVDFFGWTNVSFPAAGW